MVPGLASQGSDAIDECEGVVEVAELEGALDFPSLAGPAREPGGCGDDSVFVEQVGHGGEAGQIGR